MTPQEQRIRSVAGFISRLRAGGKSDDEIRRLLSIQKTPLEHPCASSALQNICDPNEINAAFERLKGIARRTDNIHPLVWIGGGTAALWLMGGALKKAAPILGGGAVLLWAFKEGKI